ncbi:hypothetical protein, partial [Oceanivirga salmonicida]
NIYKAVPKRIILVFIIIFGIMMIVDFVITIIQVIGIDKNLQELDNIEKNIQKISDGMGEKITTGVLKYQDTKNEMIEKFYNKYKRILKAFPSMKSKKYSKILDKIKNRMKKK